MPITAPIELLNIIYFKAYLIAIILISKKFEQTVLNYTNDDFIVLLGKIFLWFAVICSTCIMIIICVNITLGELCDPILNIIRILKEISHEFHN